MRDKVFHLVGEYFEGDVPKTLLWFAAPNPGLGNISPDEMVRRDRTENLLKFVENQLAENKLDA
jgi:hypothetical protein